MNIVLIGMMGSGKSSVGRLVAEKLKWKFIDVDRRIEEEQNDTIARLFEMRGESAFREIEKNAVARFSAEDGAVIATGGGAPCFEENWNALSRNGTIGWLKASPETLAQRLKKSGARSRPLLKGTLTVERLSRLCSERRIFYQKADLTIDVDGLDREEIAEKITRLALSEKKP